MGAAGGHNSGPEGRATRAGRLTGTGYEHRTQAGRLRRSPRLDQGALRRRRDQGGRRRGRLEYRARHGDAARPGHRRRPGAAVQQHQGLRRQRPVPPHLRLRPVELSPRRHDDGRRARHPSARARQARPQRARRRRPAEDRRDRPGQGEHRHRRRHRSLRAAVAVVEQARRRPLPPHLWRLRHQGPRHRRDERRHLSRHGGEQERDPDPDVEGPACRPACDVVGARRQDRDADRGRDRLGAVARLHRRRAGRQGRVRIRRDGLDPRRPGRARQMRDRRPPCACELGDRDRGLSPARSGEVRDGRAVRRVHRLPRRRQVAEADHPRHRHHPPQRSDPARDDRGLAAGQLLGERDLLLDHARGDGVVGAGARRRPRHHRRVVPAGACRDQPARSR